jgi:Pyridoxamine 5'-phosphate oxidase
MNRAEVLALLTDNPIARQLLSAAIPARLAYVALDGTPRAIPVAHYFDGEAFVFASPDGAPKIAALRQNPAVALTIDTIEFPPLVLLVRGTATVEMVEGVPEEYLLANRPHVGEEGFPAFEAEVTQLYDRMAKIVITPTWARAYDFQTHVPDVLQRLMEQKSAQSASG